MEALKKDQDTIREVADEVGVEARLIMSSLLVEQLRLYYSQRALFKQFFEPLKILSNSTQVSMGAMSIKPETATQIEGLLKDRNSIYYLGAEYENLLNYPSGVNISGERINRLSSEDNHHRWSYLYGAIYIKQLMTGWDKAGFSIKDRPEIIGTLFNVGFASSEPKENPQVGGSSVVIGETTYTFGYLSGEIYYSGELMEEFPLW